MKKHKVHVPFPDPKPAADAPYKVSFEPPSHINVVGSYVSKTMVKSQKSLSIDMIVEMPKGIFQDKDYLNHRYFYKRAYYLAKLVVAIQKELDGDVKVTYEYLHGNSLLPILDVTPEEPAKIKKKNAVKPHEASQMAVRPSRIRIIPCLPEELFPSTKLLPTNNCIRSNAPETKDKTLQPTPFYNSTLKADSCFLPYLRVLRQTEKSCGSFKDACMLGRIWLQQRGFGSAVAEGGFGHFEWSALSALLLQSSGNERAASLSSSLSSTQLFKAIIQFLATADFSRKPVIVGSSKNGRENLTGPTIFDSSRQHNFAFKMSVSSATWLRQHAKWTHALLANDVVEQFNPTFILKADIPLQTFDLVAEFDGDDVHGQQEAFEYRGSSWLLAERVYTVLKKALGDRASLIHVFVGDETSESTWDITSSATPQSSRIFVGIIFDQANMTRQVDHGPSVEDKKEAKKFRQFWGDKAELRRFKDGSILESLIWTQSSAAGLCEEIIRYILNFHLRLEGDGIRFYGDDYAALVPLKSSDASSFSAARDSFRAFEQDIRGLEELPLHVRQLKPTGPEMRSSSIRPPSLNTMKPPVGPMDVVIFFEASGKWPDNLAAIQRTKVALLLKIGSLLEDAKPGVTTHIGLEDAETDIENLAFLDVVYDSGAAFRLRIHSDLEETLLERRTKDKTLEQHIRTEGAQLLATAKRLYVHLPLHTQVIATFCNRFPALSPTIRMLKQWFNSHKLGSHFLEEFVELVALHVFLEPSPWQAPSSAMTGFLRTLLFLSRWDWRVEPLIIDSSESLSAADRVAVETRLEAWRKIDPNMNRTTLFVATSHDTSGTAYTASNGNPAPSKVVATRMTTLARSACKLVKEADLELNLRALFQPALSDFDVLIYLNAKLVKSIVRGDEATKSSQFKNLDARTGQTPLPLAHHPINAFLQKLKELYAGPLVFFHGAPDDNVIAAIWNPQIQRRSFRVNLPCSFKPTANQKEKASDDSDDGNDLVEVNREAILAEIARFGGDVVEKIETKSVAK